MSDTINCCFNGNKSCVLIRDVRGNNARLLLMFVTRHHAKQMLNYEYLTAARIMHGVLAYENVMRLLNIVHKYFLHFFNVLLNLCNDSDQKRDFVIH